MTSAAQQRAEGVYSSKRQLRTDDVIDMETAAGDRLSSARQICGFQSIFDRTWKQVENA